jgi:hypothetical protein
MGILIVGIGYGSGMKKTKNEEEGQGLLYGWTRSRLVAWQLGELLDCCQAFGAQFFSLTASLLLDVQKQVGLGRASAITA